MTELSFLIELLLNHDLPKSTKDLVASRIKEVEQGLIVRPAAGTRPAHPFPAPQQAPSTLAAMARQEGLVYDPAPPDMPPVEQPTQPAVVAQTAATAQALNYRNSLIAGAIANKNTDVSTGRPRKFRGDAPGVK